MKLPRSYAPISGLVEETGHQQQDIYIFLQLLLGMYRFYLSTAHCVQDSALFVATYCINGVGAFQNKVVFLVRH